MKLLTTTLPLLALSFSFLGPCSKQQATTTVVPAPSDTIYNVSVIRPEFKSVAKTHSAAGTVSASEVNTITAAGPGSIEQILVKEGDMVMQSDSIVTISNVELFNTVDIKRAKIKEMQTKLEEIKSRIGDAGGTADQPLNADDSTFLDEDSTTQQAQPKTFGPADMQTPPKTLQTLATYIEARIDTLSKEADALDRQLQSLAQMSPVTGIVTKIYVSLSNKVNTQDKLLEISTTNPMSVQFFLPETVASYIYKSGKVAVTPTTATDVRANGTIYFISPNTDPASGTIEVRAHVDNPDGRIKGGQKLNVDVSTNKMDRVVVLPKKTVFYENNKTYLFIVYKTQARKTEVTLGDEVENGLTQVLGDLRVDDPIIVDRPVGLVDGSFVKII